VIKGKVYQLDLDNDFQLIINVFDKPPITGRFANSFYLNTLSLLSTRSVCSQLYPGDTLDFENAYYLSAAGTFSEWLNLEQDFIPISAGKSKSEILEQLELSPEEAKSLCFKFYFSEIDRVEKGYGDRVNDVIKYIQEQRSQ